MQVARTIGIGVAAAVVAGIVAGALARLMMRLVTLAAGHEASFSVVGTLGIMMVFALFALPGSVLAVFVRRRGRSALLVLGTVALFVPTTSIAATDLGTQIAFTGMEMVGVSLATTGVYVAVATIPVVALSTIAVLTRSRRQSVAVVAAEPLSA